MTTGQAILASLRSGFTGLVRFSGRDGNATFWPYALTVVFGVATAYFAAFMPLLFAQMGRMRELAREHPDQFIVTEGPGSYSISYVGSDPAVMAQMAPDFGQLIALTAIFGVASFALLGAAATRRLHDRNVRGWWLWLPALLATPAMVLMPDLFAGSGQGAGGAGPFSGAFLLVFLFNGLYLLSLAGLAVMLALPGNSGSNRFGPPPML